MDRERLEELISGALDQEITPHEQAELDAELERSEAARALFATLEQQSRGLQALTPLRAEPELKASTLRRLESRSGNAGNWLWVIGTLAASFLFFWGATRFDRQVSDETVAFYLTDAGLSLSSAGSGDVVLGAAGISNRVWETEVISGFISSGSARVTLKGDGGTVSGQTLSLKLSFDVDNDGEFDLLQEAEKITVDAKDGYEVFTASFPEIPAQWKGSAIRGKARLELVGESLAGTGVHVIFPDEGGALQLPLQQIASL